MYLITGNQLALGPSTSGLWILTSAYILYISLMLVDKNLFRFFTALSLSFLMWMLYLAFLALYSFYNAQELTNHQYILFAAMLIPTSWYFLKVSFISNTNHNKMKKHKTSRPVMAMIAIFFFVSIITLAPLPYYTVTPKDTNVAIYTANMFGDMKKPEYGWYGMHSNGMFGCLPDYLNAMGYNVTIINKNISTYPIEKLDILILINPNNSFSKHDYDTIWSFVRRGGSLLVLGDHTDLAGIQKPLNQILTPVNIRFRFDSALGLDLRWTDCTMFISNPLICDGINKDALGISVGASLDIEPPAFPILIGRYAFSDHGNYLNSENANLGDYEYNSGEELGDIILVAGAFYGSGRVIVFGDTSSFQNLALPSNHDFIQNIFAWLGNKEGGTVFHIKITVGLLLIFANLVLLFVFKNKTLFYIISLLLCLALILTTIINPIVIAGATSIKGNIAYIDASHGERFSIEGFTSSSLTGFFKNLLRNNYLPIIFKEFSPQELSKSNIFVMVSPTVKFTDEEVNQLKDFMWKGGVVIISCGYQNSGCIKPLLDEMGLTIQNVPLGPVPYINQNPEYIDDPRFADAWPITTNDTNVEIFYRVEFKDTSYNIIVFNRFGWGGLLLIGDGKFLWDAYLEDISAGSYVLPNIELLRNIFQKLRSEGVLS